MSDSECELRRGGMANSDEQPSEPNRDHEGNLNSPSHFFDFANKVMACAPTARTIADDFHELPAYAKRKVLKGLVDEIMENLLKVLLKVEKEFLDDFFKALYEKLPWKSQVSVANQVSNAVPQDYGRPSAPPYFGLDPYYGRPSAPLYLEPDLYYGQPSAPPYFGLPELPGMFFVNIPDTIGSGNGRGRGRGRGQEGVKK